MRRAWRLSVYDLTLGSGATVLPGPSYRFVYGIAGRVEGRSEAGPFSVEAGSGHLAEGEITLRGAADAWIYEADPAAAAPQAAEGLSLVLSARFALDDAPLIVRADRVTTASGATTPRHGHRGPGIRRLLHGRLMAEVGETTQRIEAGQPWFESGQEPVVGTNIHRGDNAFVRVMLLPAELAGGKSSFVPWTPEEAGKPRAATYHLFGEIAALPTP